MIVHDDAGVPARLADATANFGQVVREETGRDVSPREITSRRLLGEPSLAGQAERAPVALAVRVLVDLLEPHRVEPPRGSWAQVSLIVVAVDDDRPTAVELQSRLAVQLLERDIDSAGDVLLFVLLARKHFDELRALC